MTLWKKIFNLFKLQYQTFWYNLYMNNNILMLYCFVMILVKLRKEVFNKSFLMFDIVLWWF